MRVNHQHETNNLASNSGLFGCALSAQNCAPISPEKNAKLQDDIEASINEMAEAVQAYVPGYRLKQRVQFEVIPQDKPVNLPGVGQFSGLKTAVWLEVEGAAHYLPAYAGNLDIMTSSALATAEKMAQSLARKAGEAA